MHFDYGQAFSCNLGWLTSEEQSKLRSSSVAIAGLGGAGGFQAEALARLGVGGFHLADFDRFEITNFNRQAGATVKTLGQPKVDVIRQKILDVNPEAKILTFEEGFTEKTRDPFLDSVQLVIDGIDFFALDRKAFLFDSARRKRIPAVTACPVGF